jgi:hypothetical protein
MGMLTGSVVYNGGWEEVVATVANLAGADTGERFVVRRILFDGPRTQCGTWGLQAGDRVELVERGRGGVLVRDAEGRLIRCPLDVACYVEVVRERAGTTPSPPEGAGVG